MFAGAFAGSGRKPGGYFHTSNEFLAPHPARGCFLITSRRLARRTTTQWYPGHRALEHNGTAGKGYGVTRLDPVRWPNTLAVEVDFATTDRISRRGTGFEQSNTEQPAVDARRARPRLSWCTHSRRSVIGETKSAQNINRWPRSSRRAKSCSESSRYTHRLAACSALTSADGSRSS